MKKNYLKDSKNKKISKFLYLFFLDMVNKYQEHNLKIV